MGSTALVLMMVILALLLDVGVRGKRDIPEVQGMRDASTLKESDQARTKGIHANIFNNALEQFQAQTHMVPNENIKAKIAEALKVYQARTRPQEANDGKMEFSPKMQKTDETGVTAGEDVFTDTNTNSQCSTNNNSTPPSPPPPLLPIPSTGKKSCPCKDGTDGTSISTDSYDICFCPKNGGEVGTSAGCSSTGTVGAFGNYKGLGPVQIQP